MRAWWLFVVLVAWVAVSAAAEPASLPPTVVLISLDTTRADALSCYGSPPGARVRGVVTPTLDALAAEGARFEHFYAHAPTTLNSHASMLTGLDPHRHGVPRNGFVVDPALPTLAQRLQGVGYDTVAVVGARALERAMGLDRGFRVYDDHTPVRQGPMYQDDAGGVVDRVVAQLDARAGSPEGDRALFLFAHFYDAHAPYEAPAPYRDRFADPAYSGALRDYPGAAKLRPHLLRLRGGAADEADTAYLAARYLGEVAYVDHEIGRLLDALRVRGLLDRALVVVTADHGEVLGELPRFAYSHGADVSEGSMRVPLVVRGYGLATAQRALVRRQASMDGLAPTVEALVGLPVTLGRSFAALLAPGPVADVDGWPSRPTRTVLMEATRPQREEAAEGWNNLSFARGVRAGGFAARGRPTAGEPFTADDGAGGLRAGDGGVVPLLEALVERWDAAAPAHRDEVMNDATREALRALGYVDE